MRRPLALLTSAALLAGGAYAAIAQAATKPVSVGDNYFVKSKFSNKRTSITINPGDKVQFKFVGSSPHNVSGANGIFPQGSSPTQLRTRGSITTKALRGGPYRLYCSVHGSSRSGQGITIKVRR